MAIRGSRDWRREIRPAVRQARRVGGGMVQPLRASRSSHQQGGEGRDGRALCGRALCARALCTHLYPIDLYSEYGGILLQDKSTWGVVARIVTGPHAANLDNATSTSSQ